MSSKVRHWFFSRREICYVTIEIAAGLWDCEEIDAKKSSIVNCCLLDASVLQAELPAELMVDSWLTPNSVWFLGPFSHNKTHETCANLTPCVSHSSRFSYHFGPQVHPSSSPRAGH